MQKTLRSLACLLTAFSMISAAQAAPVVGETAPDFTATDTSGNPFSLSGQKGKIVVLEWKNHECPFVKKHYGAHNMQNIQQQVTELGGVWVSVISSAPGKQGYVSAEEANTIAKDQGAKQTAIILDPDGTIGRMYDAKTTPHMFVIDAGGKLAYMGAIDDKPTADMADISEARNYVYEAVMALSTGKHPEVSSTSPYGCGVKY